MLKISNSQFKAQEVAAEELLCKRLASRLRQEMPMETNNIENQEMLVQIRQAVEASDKLNIEKEDDIFRFLRLKYLPSEAWRNPHAHQVFYECFTDTSIDASLRLSFVEENLLKNN